MISKETRMNLKRQFAVFDNIIFFFEYQDSSDYWANLGTNYLIEKRNTKFYNLFSKKSWQSPNLIPLSITSSPVLPARKQSQK